MAQMTTSSINDLPDAAFAYIEPGGTKDSIGKTVPRSLRHFPVHDKAHAANALSRAPQSPFGEKAMPKIKAAAKKFGVDVSDGGRSVLADEEIRELRITSQYRDLDARLEIRAGQRRRPVDRRLRVRVHAAGVPEPRRVHRAGRRRRRSTSPARPGGRTWCAGTTTTATSCWARRRRTRCGCRPTTWAWTTRCCRRSPALTCGNWCSAATSATPAFAFRVPSGGDEWGVTDHELPDADPAHRASWSTWPRC